MKNLLFAACAVLFLISCGEQEVSLNSLNNRDGVQYIKNSNDLFNGTAVGLTKEFLKNNVFKSIEDTPSTEIESINVYMDGLLVEQTVYHTNGQMSEKTEYSEGVKDGNYATYFQNGQIREEGSFCEGGPCKECKTFDHTGKLLTVKTFENVSWQGKEGYQVVEQIDYKKDSDNVETEFTASGFKKNKTITYHNNGEKSSVKIINGNKTDHELFNNKGMIVESNKTIEDGGKLFLSNIVYWSGTEIVGYEYIKSLDGLRTLSIKQHNGPNGQDWSSRDNLKNGNGWYFHFNSSKKPINCYFFANGKRVSHPFTGKKHTVNKRNMHNGYVTRNFEFSHNKLQVVKQRGSERLRKSKYDLSRVNGKIMAKTFQGGYFIILDDYEEGWVKNFYERGAIGFYFHRRNSRGQHAGRLPTDHPLYGYWEFKYMNHI